MSAAEPAPVELRTARLLLRPPRSDDADAYVALASDPEFAAFGSRRPPDRAATIRALARIIATPWQRRPEFAVILEDRVIGRVSLDVDAVNQAAALGYGIARAHWGRGLATEAAGAVVDYAFAALGLAKVWARVDPRNEASVRVLEKLGMQREGLQRSHVVHWGERADRALYGLLRAEWRGRRAAAGD